MEKSTTVIFWGREDVIGQGVESLLRDRKDWNVIRVLGEHGSDVLLREVKNANPDVVILYQGNCASDPTLPLQLIEDHAGLRVITFSLENSSMEVYNKKKVWVTEVSDLLDIVGTIESARHPK